MTPQGGGGVNSQPTEPPQDIYPQTVDMGNVMWLDNDMNRNETINYIVTAGEVTLAEKCRNSLGGFQNMVARVEQALGGKLRNWTTSQAGFEACAELVGTGTTVSFEKFDGVL